ncbi:outer membrane lipid asymmetry maintenance protein MlaD [Pseudomonas oryzihabitans]|uniref:outer membrane lipid asymmetry maintenance protein MlaD n=1 Tax=Pseudomonas oryzihabitans TaxID=47885 RepID=UPI00135E9A6C|nr:outer membrane lipid asymmetry maintenance protein MlaD [Pseudomonas oryzihabitans]MXS21559.1 outer membrane lipid asymmetry maintenance protein MlaD [Pseudomonas oryzihabitans]
MIKKAEFLVGCLVLVSLVSLVFLALKASNLTGFERTERYPLTASFADIGSLRPQAPVKSAGVLIGRVESVSFDPERFEAVVTLNIISNFRFPTDSAAKILTSGLLGEQYVGIEPGGEETYLAPGDAFTQTQSALVLENLVGRFITSMTGGEGNAP